ncbi:restriction endonuclease [Streptomyces xanthophaeus]
MHINWTTAVEVPEYPSTQLQEVLRRCISDATDDDLLAAYLHWTEGQVAIDWFGEAHDLESELHEELAQLDALICPEDNPFTETYLSAHDSLRRALTQANNTAATTQSQARSAWFHLSRQPPKDLASKYRRDANPSGSPVHSMGRTRARLLQAARNVREALAKHRDAMHELALREAEMDSFLKTEHSISLDDIHAMTPAGFEQAVATLARRDGFNILREGGGARDLGADVIAVTPESLRIVFQCKHRQAGLKKVGSPEIQTLNGTARPEHRADIVVAVTNGRFTKPATDFAHDHQIHLVDQALLNRWARWGEPLMTVLGLKDPGPRFVLSDRA